MTIHPENFKIEMTHDEVWDLMFDIRRALESTLKTHWVNHQNVWKENEKKRLDRLNKFCLSLGRPDIYEEVFKIADDTFSEFNKGKK